MKNADIMLTICLQELTDAIFAVTEMDPNMSVQKIEIHTRSEEV